VAKEKFELVFMGGGAVISMLNNRLRRGSVTPRDEVGFAMHDLGLAFEERRVSLARPAQAAAAEELAAISSELCETTPRRDVVDAHLDAFARMLSRVDELPEAVDRLRDAVAAWLD
jgi:hypothetical protein